MPRPLDLPQNGAGILGGCRLGHDAAVALRVLARGLGQHVDAPALVGDGGGSRLGVGLGGIVGGQRPGPEGQDHCERQEGDGEEQTETHSGFSTPIRARGEVPPSHGDREKKRGKITSRFLGF